jgi:hypothetical protein
MRYCEVAFCFSGADGHMVETHPGLIFIAASN